MAELGLRENEFKGVTHWIDARLPVFTAMHKEYRQFPTPKNFNYFWNFGALATVNLLIMIVTGVFLAMNYDPTTAGAFDSVQRIMRDVNWGWMIRYIHVVGATLFFVTIYVHIFRGLYYGSYKKPRELIWILGVILFLLLMATAFMGYVLPWGQMSFWGATVITSLFGAIPVVGHGIVSWLWGGFAVSQPTLNRFFSLHYLFPFIIVFFVFLHVMALHTVGSNNPLGIDVKGPQDTLPFHPYYTAKDSVGVCVYLIVFAILVFFIPHQPLLLDPNNAIQANPLQTPSDIVPEWYFLPFYAILRSVPNKLGGVVLLFGSIFVLFFLPVLDTSPVRSCRFRPIMRWLWLLFVIDVFVLGWVGSNKPIGTFILIGRLATVWYFIHMLIFLPLIGKLERPLPLPESISKSVLGGGGGALRTAAAQPMEKA